MSKVWLRRRIAGPILVGEWMFSDQRANVSLAGVFGLIRANIWTAIMTLWTATMHALVARFALGSLASLLIYVLLTPILKRTGEALREES